MTTSFRQDDREWLRGFTRVLRETVYGMHPEMSVEQVAGHVTSGADDPFAVTADTLRKVLECRRRLHPHKLVALMELASALGRPHEEAYAVLTWMCLETGHLPPVPMPNAAARNLSVIQKAVHEFAEWLDEATAARGPDSDGGAKITAAEAARIEKEGREAQSAIETAIQWAKWEAGGNKRLHAM